MLQHWYDHFFHLVYYLIDSSFFDLSYITRNTINLECKFSFFEQLFKFDYISRISSLMAQVVELRVKGVERVKGFRFKFRRRRKN